MLFKLQDRQEQPPKAMLGPQKVYLSVCACGGGAARSSCYGVPFLSQQKTYRQRADELKFTSVADSSQMEHAKKSQELQSGVSPRLPFLHQAAVS